MNKSIYKFNALSSCEETTVWDSMAGRLRRKLNEGNKLSRDENHWLYVQLATNSYFSHGVPVLGWCVPFDDVLSTYIVKLKNGSLFETQAPNKTCIRKYYGDNKVVYIVNLEKAK